AAWWVTAPGPLRKTACERSTTPTVTANCASVHPARTGPGPATEARHRRCPAAGPWRQLCHVATAGCPAWLYRLTAGPSQPDRRCGTERLQCRLQGSTLRPPQRQGTPAAGDSHLPALGHRAHAVSG